MTENERDLLLRLAEVVAGLVQGRELVRSHQLGGSSPVGPKAAQAIIDAAEKVHGEAADAEAAVATFRDVLAP